MDKDIEMKVFSAMETYDGAGVKLKRIFAIDSTRLTDPFLLLDHFGSDKPEDYIKGFPWHPHRGIETVTYMLDGEVEHGDSLKHSGVIRSGDIQWMTAGSGIIHQEMPKASKTKMEGFQLWVNLPSKEKMMPPRYRGILKNEIPTVTVDNAIVKVISGKFQNKIGPVKDLIIDVEYLDVEARGFFEYIAKKSYTTFLYFYEGHGVVNDVKVNNHHLILFLDKNKINVQVSGLTKFILVSGKPIGEPIAWGGPIVMNTREELEVAFRELNEGTFIKHD